MFSPNCVVAVISPEISLKSPQVRSFLQTKLKHSIIEYLKKENVPYSDISFFTGRFFIQTTKPQNAIIALSTCFGIFSLGVAEKKKVEGINEINLVVEDICKNNLRETFAIRGRSFSKSFSSKELEIALGSKVLQICPELKVNLSSPKSELFCLAFDKFAFFYFSLTLAAGGMPVGSQGRVGLVGDSDKVLSLGFLLLRVGCSILYSGNKDLSSLEKYNAFFKFKPVSKEFLKENIVEGDISGLFCDAVTLSDSEKVSQDFGFKVFAPFLIDQPKTPFD